MGVVGCGNIAPVYLSNLSESGRVRLVGLADLDSAKASGLGAEFDVPATSVADLLADPAVELVVNLTVPAAHEEVSLRALDAGKHVYSEKPLALTFAGAGKLVALAERKSLSLGCAPDTILGAGIQTCRRLIAEGAIGEVVGGVAFMMCGGHESWHPAPAFYYEVGGGPLFDMGPYYLSALVELLGPIERTSGTTRTTHAKRTIGSEPLRGATIEVETPTHVAGLLTFARGPIVAMAMSFDVPRHGLPHIELHGTAGTLRVPDPNGFGGPVHLGHPGRDDWIEVPLDSGPCHNARGLGLLDLLEQGAGSPVSGQRALHVVETMEAVLSGNSIALTTADVVLGTG